MVCNPMPTGRMYLLTFVIQCCIKAWPKSLSAPPNELVEARAQTTFWFGGGGGGGLTNLSIANAQKRASTNLLFRIWLCCYTKIIIAM